MFTWSKHTSVILADEMGLGKTCQSVNFVAAVHAQTKVLVFVASFAIVRVHVDPQGAAPFLYPGELWD